MSAQPTTTPTAVPAEKAPRASRTNRHSRSGPSLADLVKILQEKWKGTEPLSEEAARGFLKDPDVRGPTIAVWEKRREAAQAEAKKVADAEAKQKDEAKKKLLGELNAEVAPPAPVSESKGDRKVVPLRSVKPWEPKKPDGDIVEKFKARLNVVLPGFVFEGWELATAFRLLLLQAEKALREARFKASGEYLMAINERRSVILDTLNKGVNRVIRELYGFTDAKDARASHEVIAETERRIAGTDFAKVLEVPEPPKPETPEEKQAREAAEAARLAKLKKEAEEKNAAITEIAKRLVEKAGMDKETALKVAWKIAYKRPGPTAVSKLRAAAIGSLKAASQVRANDAEGAERFMETSKKYALAAEVDFAVIQDEFAAKKATELVKAEQAKASAFTNSGAGIAKPLSEAAARRQAEEARRDKAAKKEAKNKQKKGKGDRK